MAPQFGGTKAGSRTLGFGNRTSLSHRLRQPWFMIAGLLALTLPLTNLDCVTTTQPGDSAFTFYSSNPATVDNSPPSVSFRDELAVPHLIAWEFFAHCADPDVGDKTRLTWVWGDGKESVTNHESTGGSFVASTMHTYVLRKVYNVVVWIDDLTGLPGHNVSDDGTVVVGPWFPHPPVVQSFSVSNPSPYVGEEVTFQALVTDPDGDLCILNFTFGDGTWQTIIQVMPNTTVLVTHAYLTPGSYLAWVDASDWWAPPVTSSAPIAIDVTMFEFTVNLVPGWNLVSLPLIDHGYTASMLELDFGDMVAGWNMTTRSYGEIYIFGISPPSDDFALESSTGYWIHASVAKAVGITGYPPTEVQTRTITVAPTGGWAFIGFASLRSVGHASDISRMYSGEVIYAFRFNSIAQVWDLYLSGIPMSDFPLVPGEGYLIFCTSGILSYSPG